MAGIGAIFSLFGSVVGAAGQMAAARAQKEAADREALQQEAEARERLAKARIEADQEKRQKDLALSELQATAAGSGFSATDATAIQLATDIEEYGTFREQLALYGGQTEYGKLNYAAGTTRKKGEAAYKAAKASALGSILGGFASFAKSSSSASPVGLYR